MVSRGSDHEELSKMKAKSTASCLKEAFCFTRIILKKGTKDIEISDYGIRYRKAG